MALPLGLSYRRALLDTVLERRAAALDGLVVEVGAKRRPRGRFRPPLDSVRRWVRLDLDPRERPDVVGDVQALPVRYASVDAVVCVEVLQYVGTPEAAMRELARVLARDGALVLAVPFLHRADGPADRHRFTETRVRELIEGVGLRIVDVEAQGHLFTTIANQLRQGVAHVRARPLRWLLAAFVVPLTALLLELDRIGSVERSTFLASFTTGFVAVGRKG